MKKNYICGTRCYGILNALKSKAKRIENKRLREISKKGANNGFPNKSNIEIGNWLELPKLREAIEC